jgi:cytochrome bd-type quinol oxidase subunit 2
MRFVPRALQAYAHDARAAFTHAPLEVLVGVLVAITFAVTQRGSGRGQYDLWWRVAAASALAFPLLLSLSVLRARGVLDARLRWLLSAAVLAAAASYGWLVLDPDHDAEAWRWFLLAAAAVLALLLTPVAGNGERAEVRRRTWSFGYKGIVRTVGVLGYAALLYLALSGAVGAVTTLFDLETPKHLYTDLFAAVFFALAPWILVGGIPRLIEPWRGDTAVPKPLSIAGRFLYVPVLVVYLAILYAYTVRVLVTGEIPKNLVSPLVIAAGLLGFGVALLLEPVHGDPEHRGVSRAVRLLPAALIPVLPLAFWAVLQRQAQYGWTEFRYIRLVVLVLLAILAVLGTVRLVRRQPPVLSSVLAVFLAASLLAAVGPWSATAVSRRSQTARLEDGLRRIGLRDRAAWANQLTRKDGLRVDSARYEQITSSASYLYRNHGAAALRRVFPGVPDTLPTGESVTALLHLVRSCGPPESDVSASFDWNGGVAGIEGGVMQQLNVTRGDPDTVVFTGGPTLTARLEPDAVVFRAGGADAWEARVELAAVRAQVNRMAARCPRPEYDAIYIDHALALQPLMDAAGRRRGQLLVTEAGIQNAPDTITAKGKVVRIDAPGFRRVGGSLFLRPSTAAPASPVH